MKVAPGSNSELNLNKKVDNQSSRSELDANAGGDVNSDALGEKLDFASVLDRVTKEHEHPRSRPEDHHSSPSNKADSKKSAGKEDEDTNTIASGTMVGADNASQVRTETAIGPDSILHVADLDKIVEACRVQVAPGGQTEVVIDLSRSVLEGLRVKVQTDGAGRVTAEFLAANEGIKSLLDSRSAELSALLRARGINLTEFKSSVAADSNSGKNNPERHFRQQVASASGASVESVHASDDSEPEASDGASGATYRA